MRIKEMYLICKRALQKIRDIQFVATKHGSTRDEYTLHTYEGAEDLRLTLSELKAVEPLTEAVGALFPEEALDRYADMIRLNDDGIRQFKRQKGLLIERMLAVISIGEAHGLTEIEEDEEGIDVWFPIGLGLGETGDCLDVLSEAFERNPFIAQRNLEIKFTHFETGSLWASFLSIGKDAKEAIGIITAVIGAAAKVKNYYREKRNANAYLDKIPLSAEQREDIDRKAQEDEGKRIEDIVDGLIQKYGELKAEDEKLALARTLQRLGAWLERGLEVYQPLERGGALLVLDAEGMQEKKLLETERKLLTEGEKPDAQENEGGEAE